MGRIGLNYPWYAASRWKPVIVCTVPGSPLSPQFPGVLLQQHQEQGFLCMKAVFGLIEHNGL